MQMRKFYGDVILHDGDDRCLRCTICNKDVKDQCPSCGLCLHDDCADAILSEVYAGRIESAATALELEHGSPILALCELLSKSPSAPLCLLCEGVQQTLASR